jgi:voltage-gated sodium channel
MAAEGATFWRYFRDPWNVFDFTIVAASFLPFAGQGVVVLRLIRLLRVLRLVHALPKLQLLVGALLKSLPSMGYVSLLLLLLFYIFAVSGTFLFGHNDPRHWGTLERSFLTLFETVTLEGWVDVLDIQMQGCARSGYEDAPELCTQSAARPVIAVVFFVSFILMGTMIMLNLFIGVIMNGMQEAHAESDRLKAEDAAAASLGTAPSLKDEIDRLRAKLAEIGEQAQRIEDAAARVNRGS